MSVTRGQCNARPTVTFPAARHHAHCLVPNYTAWWQRHMCVNNLPRVALDRLVDHKSGIKTTCLPSHTQDLCNVEDLLLIVPLLTAASLWLKQLTFTQQIWVQGSMSFIQLIGSVRNGIWPNGSTLHSQGQSSVQVSTSKSLNNGVHNIKISLFHILFIMN